jgi:regulator of sigma E protease
MIRFGGLMQTLFSSEGLLIGTLLPFLFVLTMVVFVHEMGHYLVGRWCGIGVEAFSIGFGPELVGFNDRRGTRWKLSAIPLGGYVKFVGDTGPASMRDQDDIDALSPQQHAVAFHTRARWKRALTIFAGPAANFLLTIAIFAVFFTLNGRMIADPTVSTVQPGSAAEKAGFLPGDTFVSVDGNPVTTFEDVQRIVSVRAGDELVFVLNRDGKDLTVTATPTATERPDPLGNTITLGVLGVMTDRETGQFRRIEYGPVAALGEAVSETGYMIARTGEFVGRLVRGREDRCQLGGPVKIANMAGQAAKRGFDWLIQLTAMLSVGIGILNLMPVPPLDGGHLMFYAIEAVTRRPVPEVIVEWVYRIGFAAVLALMAFVFWNDLVAC